MVFKMCDGHWQIMIDFMISHKQFARGPYIGVCGKATQRKLWEKLTADLNSLGLGNRSVEKWQKSWADMKYSCKKKAAARKHELTATGGGPYIPGQMTQWEEKVLHIMGDTFHRGVSSAECGVPEMQDQLPSTSTAEEDYNKDSVIEKGVHRASYKNNPGNISTPHDGHDYLCHTPNRKRKAKEEIENQLYKDTIHELQSIKTELKNIGGVLKEISTTLKDFVHNNSKK